jgi:bacterioferritin-associated ferredoxin
MMDCAHYCAVVRDAATLRSVQSRMLAQEHAPVGGACGYCWNGAQWLFEGG